MTDHDPLSADHDAVLWTSPDSITIGASPDHMEVYLPPESAEIQSAPVINLVATEDIENPLWAAGYKQQSGNHYTTVLTVDRKQLQCNTMSRIVRCYSILFGDTVEEQYYDNVRDHFSGANYRVKRL